MKGYNTEEGYMGYVEGTWMLLAAKRIIMNSWSEKP